MLARAASPFIVTCSQVLGVSIDSQFSHLAWIQTGEPAALWCMQSCALCPKQWFHTMQAQRGFVGALLMRYNAMDARLCALPVAADRKQGGVGDLKYPLVADLKREIR